MKKYQHFACLLFCLMTVNICTAQTKNNCTQTLDSVSVLKLVKNKGLLLMPKGVTEEQMKISPSLAPKVSFNESKCIWTVVSKTYETTKKGKCKNTNGCTVEITKTVLVSASTKKIISQKTTKKTKPNYE